ncbi:MAG: bifunctional 5,10-methylenetetrahydrofolate dehydrogenase/5,10-methenyltetrahydrofolate cyclohydrolase, partial [Candidatus Binataceae bacterium]
MSAIVMDGRALSERLKPQLRAHAKELVERYGVTPALGAILAGDSAASIQYVRNKRRLAEELGFTTELVTIPAAAATTDHLLESIQRFNDDPRITGILLQLPLPAGVDNFRLFDAIAPGKDVDAVSASSISGFYRGEWGRFIPCTPRGVLALLECYAVPLDGMRAAVIGRSDIAGKPMALILGGRLVNSTVTWCHRHTHELAEICREADLIVSCAGVDLGENRFLINAEMVKPGACVIDVGFRRVGPGRFAGDVDFAAVSRVAKWITPNPGGTGPMTVAALMQNLIDAARYRLGLE